MLRSHHSIGWGRRCGRTRGARAVRAAFTLVEVVVIIMIAGVALLSLGVGFRAGVQNLRQGVALRAALLRAEDLMREIRSREFSDPESPGAFGSEEGTVRRDFDDVDDYAWLTNSPPTTIEGVVMTNYSGYTEQVTIENVLSQDFNAAPQPNGTTGFARITVVVSNRDVAVTVVSVVSEYD